MSNLFPARVLSRRRIIAAVAIALLADVLQVALGPFGWVFFDQVIDVVAMVATTFLLGFHPLLLPTFFIEVVPIVDMLPTWTGCVIAVVLLRRRRETTVPVTTQTRDMKMPVIEV